jgi:hypothetical protein
MLNNTFHTLGFGNAVRASAGLVSGCLLIGCLLMRPRLPPATSHPPILKSLPRFARDTPYVFAVLGCVPHSLFIWATLITSDRMTTYTVGFYFPLFYLQLDAITHGINETLSFYSVRPLPTVGDDRTDWWI